MLGRLFGSLALAAISHGLLIAEPAAAGDPRSNPAAVKVSLERLEDGSWKTLDPRTVLQKNDRVRFRMETTFAGYLFVNNLGSDGTLERIFPPVQSGADNRVEPGQSYLLPSAEGSFVIDGPPGFDITYWVITPGGTAGVPATPTTPKTSPYNSLIPKCSGGEGGLVPRGGCLDERAGPQRTRNVSTGGLRARSLKIDRSGEQTKIVGEGSGNAPLVYEFRIAHQ